MKICRGVGTNRNLKNRKEKKMKAKMYYGIVKKKYKELGIW